MDFDQVKSILRTKPAPQPTKFTFLNEQDVLFLAQDASGKLQTLFHCNINVPENEWTPVVQSLPKQKETLSKEEELLRERQRMLAVGVTDYQLSPK